MHRNVRTPGPRALAETHYWLSRMDLNEIDEALRFVGLCHLNGTMTPKEALEWRWKILACWAELQREAREERAGT